MVNACRNCSNGSRSEGYSVLAAVIPLPKIETELMLHEINQQVPLSPKPETGATY
jgi:hypothetical protein